MKVELKVPNGYDVMEVIKLLNHEKDVAKSIKNDHIRELAVGHIDLLFGAFVNGRDKVEGFGTHITVIDGDIDYHIYDGQTRSFSVEP